MGSTMDFWKFLKLLVGNREVWIMRGVLLAVFAVVWLVYMWWAGFFRRKPKALKPGETVHFALIDKKDVSHDTRRLRFELPSKDHILGLPVGNHFSISFKDKDGKTVSRPYTPTSSDDERGYVDLVVKVYKANVHPKFPEGGKMSQYLDQLTIGEKIAVEGPKGRIQYMGRGVFSVKQLPRDGGGRVNKPCKHIGMIAGGTGITPMVQIMVQIAKDVGDKTKVSLLFANQREDDILLRHDIDLLCKQFGFDVWYTLDHPPSNWNYSTGFVDAKMMMKHLPPPGPDTLLLFCGPPMMFKHAVLPAYKDLGYTKDMHLEF